MSAPSYYFHHGLSYSVYNCTQKAGWQQDPFCLAMIALSVLSLFTWCVGVASAIRICVISQKKYNFYSLVNLGLFLSNTTGCLYVLVYDIFILRYINEWINSTVMFGFVGYFALSIIRFRIIPEWLTQFKAMVALVTYYVPFCVAFGLTIYNHDAHGCRETARMIFHVLEFSIAVFFLLFGWIIIEKAEASITMSKGYLLKHTKPMLVVMLLFAMIASVNFSTYIYFYHVTGEFNMPEHLDCTVLMLTHLDLQAVKFYVIIQILYRILPLWGLYWYLYSTTKVYQAHPQNVYYGVDYNPNRASGPVDVGTMDTLTDMENSGRFDHAANTRVAMHANANLGKYRNYLSPIQMTNMPDMEDDDFPASLASKNSLMNDSMIRQMDY